MNLRPLVNAGLAAILLIAGTVAWFTRDQRQLNGSLKRLQKIVSKSEEEKAIGGLIRAKEIAGSFTSPVEVNIGAPWPILKDRDELAAAIHHVRSTAQSLQIIIRDKTLSLAPDRQTADMDITVEALATYGGQSDRDIRTYSLTWVKRQGTWLISKVEPKEIIRRPPGLEESFF